MESPATDSLFIVIGVVVVFFWGYHAFWCKMTALPLTAHKMKPNDASRGRIWCYLWAAIFVLASSLFQVAKGFGVKTPGEEEYENFLVTVIGGGKSVIAHLANNVLPYRAVYLAVMPACLESALRKGSTSPKTVSLVYFLLPLSHVWVILHQIVMTLLNGGSTINLEWAERGFTKGYTTSPDIDVLYWFSNVLYVLVFALVGLLSMNGGSMTGPFVGKFKNKEAARKASAEFLYFWVNFFYMLFGAWMLLANHGIADPTAPGEYFVEPMVPGRRKVYSKAFDQMAMHALYVIAGAQLFPCLRDEGEGKAQATFWTKLDAISSISVQLTYFSTAFYMNSKMRGHFMHPSWTLVAGAPATAGWLIDRIFFFCTVNFTAINTNIHVATVIGHLPKVMYKPFETCANNVRTNFVFHGLLVVVVSGFWAYAVMAGLIVPFTVGGIREKLSHPPIHQVNIRYAILLHMHHLFNGIIMAAVGVIIYNLEDYLKKNFSAGLNLQTFSKFWTKMLWLSTISSMVATHMQVIPACHSPLVEGSETTAFKLASSASMLTSTLFRFGGGAFFLKYVFTAGTHYRQLYKKVE
ncbi:hypothetical protein HOP50_03g27510 [Chloropicon primus]|uniref:Uncharacterized protein n=1 Tax=Chloropicon primus TaxID=1764295 RepID=A0A5B8MIF7_9CHLO|nr:hypothetical protein A3770_03p27510 [Chloropicon primus]UPQ99443.1 hypothetical protein HOP50_03g27510 [Chloropicon primus]|eukprot:QDZ20233.1 hypothetical protein A3770_03p27510 [Chloropicon primus]